MAKEIQPSILESKHSSQASVLWFKDISGANTTAVGGKNAILGDIFGSAAKFGVSVPNGFAITASVYRSIMAINGLRKKIKDTLRGLEATNSKNLAKISKTVRALIQKTAIPAEVEREIMAAYRQLGAGAVAVRPSPVAEGFPVSEIRGQYDSFLNVTGEKELLIAIKACLSSLFTDKAILHRETRGYDHLAVAMSVTIQQMAPVGSGVSGTLVTHDPATGFAGVVLIRASYGLNGASALSQNFADELCVFKEGVRLGKNAVIGKRIGLKETKLVGAKQGTQLARVDKLERDRLAISDSDAARLARAALALEVHFGAAQEITWAINRQDGAIFILQSHPVADVVSRAFVEQYELKKQGELLATGIAVGQKIGAGKVRIVETPKQMGNVKKGEVVVARAINQDWEQTMRLAAAVIVEEGGATSHAAIMAREIGVPCVVGVFGARKLFHNNQSVTVSCADSGEGRVYKGVLPFEVKRTEISKVPNTKTGIMMNMADPENAFALAAMPNDGVGLLREEFIFTNFIRIHPLALAHFNSLKDKAAKKKIASLTRGYAKKTDYCVDKLAEGMSRIAAAVYPKPVVFRLSDFKTDEYATLIGGREFEPKEQNPMLGWRGASRYYSKEYKDGFRLECAAIKKAREIWGLENIIVMVPFCRTPEEGEKVLATMAEFGLKKGENNLKVYVMCEIPSNVILAEHFARMFDGFSIGSNDLTMLTLGVDREASLPQANFTVQNEAVKQLIRGVIRVAHRSGKSVGICGQAPSDHPEFAEFLVQAGIDSISLNPDTVLSTRERVAMVEKTLGKTGKKTSIPALTMVSVFAVLAASLMALGAGCREQALPRDLAQYSESSGPSPAQVRQQVEEKIKKAYETSEAGKTVTLTEDSFAHFTLKYPEAWSVQQWRGGVSLKDPSGAESVNIFTQLVSHPVPSTQKQAITVGGKPAVRYEAVIGEVKNTIVEINMGDDEVLEINSNSPRFDEILATLTFTNSTSPDRAATHWDVREKRLCAQMITYARPAKNSACVAYATPCEVPDSYEVCDNKDI